MIKKNPLGTLLVLSLTTTFMLTWPGVGICIDKTRINLSEYRGVRNKTFIAYKYAFGVLHVGTLQQVVTPTDFGFNLAWNEEYPTSGGGDGTATYLANEYEDTAQGSLERNIIRYAVIPDGFGNVSRGDEIYRARYRDPAPPGVAGTLHPLLNFPYAEVEVGYMWGDAFIEKKFREDVNFARVYQYAILGLQDVIVPAGTFVDCVKIARFRGNQADRIAWYAKGIGLVKMIYAQEEHSHFIAETNTQLQVQGYNRAFELSTLDD